MFRSGSPVGEAVVQPLRRALGYDAIYVCFAEAISKG
jgi:hypothetical protein